MKIICLSLAAGEIFFISSEVVWCSLLDKENNVTLHISFFVLAAEKLRAKFVALL